MREDVKPFSLGNGFQRDAENGNRDGRAPHSKPVADDVRSLLLKIRNPPSPILN